MIQGLGFGVQGLGSGDLIRRLVIGAVGVIIGVFSPKYTD